MRITVIKIGDVKKGKKRFRRGYRTIWFACQDGEFALSCVPTEATNWLRWGPLQVGQSFNGALYYRNANPRVIDSDSPVVPSPGEPCQLKKKPKAKPKQLELFPQEELKLHGQARTTENYE